MRKAKVICPFPKQPKAFRNADPLGTGLCHFRPASWWPCPHQVELQPSKVLSGPCSGQSPALPVLTPGALIMHGASFIHQLFTEHLL